MVILGLSEPSHNVESKESCSAHQVLIWEPGDPDSSLSVALIQGVIWVKAHPLRGPQSVHVDNSWEVLNEL